MKLLLMMVMMVATVAAQWGPGNPSAQLPQFVVGPAGELFLRADPEYQAPMQFRCMMPAVSTSCTTLNPDLEKPGDRKAIRWVRQMITQALKEKGAGFIRMRFDWDESLGFAGGYFAIIQTDRGEARLNALWVALWRMLPGETDASVRQKIQATLEKSIL